MMTVRALKEAEAKKILRAELKRRQVVVTKEMLDAGWPHLASFDPDGSSIEETLTEIYRSMEAARA
jgi:hypothetical protein